MVSPIERVALRHQYHGVPVGWGEENKVVVISQSTVLQDLASRLYLRDGDETSREGAFLGEDVKQP